jgi:hypothetical protein
MSRKSIAESARIVRWFAIAALVLILVAFAIVRLGIDLGPQLTVVSRSHTSEMSAVGLISDLAVLLFVISLVQLIRLLGRLSSGTMFGPAVTGAFRTFAFWLLLAAVVAIGGPLVAGGLSAAFGQSHFVEVRISMRDVMFLIAGMVMFLVARMLDEAARIEAELEEIV